MTATEIQDLARRLSNWSYIRHWLHLNYPQQEPWLMGIKSNPACDLQSPTIAREMQKMGGEWDARDLMWVFRRTDDKGQPYTSRL